MKALVSGQPSLLLCRTRPRAAATRAANFPCPSSSSSSSLPMVALSQSNLPIANQGLVLGLHCALTRRRTTPPVANAQSLPGYTDDGDDHDTSSFASASDALFRLQPGGVRSQLILLALPAVLGQAIDPLAQLMETAYIGRLGALELASAGIGVAIFNILSKIFNIPLLSIATSFVAEDISKNASKHSSSGKLELPSVSSALILAAGIGIIEALALFLGSGLFLKLMGVSPASPMHKSAQLFLSLRALGAPANVIMLAVQGIFRGFKDTKTPVFYIGLGNLSAVVLLPLLIYGFGLGITGAAISTVASQYIIAILLLWSLSRRAVLLPPMMEQLEFSGYLKSGRPYHRNKTHNRCSTKFIHCWFAGFQLSALKQPTSSINTSNGSLLIRTCFNSFICVFLKCLDGMLLGRTLSILLTMTISTSMVARQGPTAMAAHQICLQVWLAVSLLADALAVSVQAIIAMVQKAMEYIDLTPDVDTRIELIKTLSSVAAGKVRSMAT